MKKLHEKTAPAEAAIAWHNATKDTRGFPFPNDHERAKDGPDKPPRRYEVKLVETGGSPHYVIADALLGGRVSPPYWRDRLAAGTGHATFATREEAETACALLNENDTELPAAFAWWWRWHVIHRLRAIERAADIDRNHSDDHSGLASHEYVHQYVKERVQAVRTAGTFARRRVSRLEAKVVQLEQAVEILRSLAPDSPPRWSALSGGAPAEAMDSREMPVPPGCERVRVEFDTHTVWADADHDVAAAVHERINDIMGSDYLKVEVG